MSYLLFYLDVAESPHSSSRSRRKGNPRKVNVELLEHNDDTVNIHNTDDDGMPMKAFRYHPMQSEISSDSLSDKHKRAASNQAKSISSRLRCDYCCITFENEYYYDLHMSSHDPEEEMYFENTDDTEVWQINEDDMTLFQDKPLVNSEEGVKQSFKKAPEKEKVHRNVPQSCELCYKTFIYKKSMRKHKLDCHAGTTCTTCWKTCISTQALNEHKCELPQKPGKGKSKKIIVSTAIKENNGMNGVNHEMIHNMNQEIPQGINQGINHGMSISPFNSLQCNICDKTFKHASDLRKHAVCHSDETPFPCTKCEKKFKRKKNLNSHLERCLGPDKVQLKCSRCPKTFWTQGYLRMHERIHDGTNPYYCEPCDKYFLKKSKLQRHLASDERRKLRAESAEANNKLPYKCSFCEKVFLDKRNHEMHERIHKGTNPHYCKECDHHFLKRRHLIHHLKSVHSDETPFSCMKCDKRFKFSDALNAHMRSHEKESTGIGKFQCITCGQMFTGLLNLKEHLNVSTTCHSLECELCGQKFLRKKQLTRHMVVHTKERPFPCSQCHRAYAFRWELTKHERTHVKQEQYSCDRCNETFSQKSELSDHIIWHETGKYGNDCPECGQDLNKQSTIDDVEGNSEDILMCGTCGKGYTSNSGLNNHGGNHSVKEENGPGVLSSFSKQRSSTEESLEIYQSPHMSSLTGNTGASKPRSLETLNQFYLRKDEEYHRIHNSEGMNVQVCKEEYDNDTITVLPDNRSEPMITSSNDRSLTYSEETKEHNTMKHSLNESTSSMTMVSKVHSETVDAHQDDNTSNQHNEFKVTEASKQNSFENNLTRSSNQQYLQPDSLDHNDGICEGNSPLPRMGMHTSRGRSSPISSSEYITTTTDSATAGIYSHKKEVLITTSQSVLVPKSIIENGAQTSDPIIESNYALTSGSIFPIRSVTQHIESTHNSTLSTSLPSTVETVQDHLLDSSPGFLSMQSSHSSTNTTNHKNRLDKDATQDADEDDELEGSKLSQIASQYPGSPQSLPYASPQSMPYASPQSMPHDSPQSSTHTSPESLPYESPQSMPYASPQSLPQNSPQSLPHTFPQSLPHTSQSLPHTSPQSLPNSSQSLPHTSESLPHTSPQSLPHTSPQSLPQVSSQSSAYASPQSLPQVSSQSSAYASPQSLPHVSSQFNSSQTTNDFPSFQSAQETMKYTLSESASPRFHNDVNTIPPLNSSQNLTSHEERLVSSKNPFSPTASQYITQSYSHGQSFKQEKNGNHITSQSFDYQREGETPSPPVQPRGYSDLLEFNNERFEEDSTSEMSTIRPLSFGFSEPQHVNNISASFTDGLHRISSEQNMRYPLTNEIPSLYSNPRIPLSDSIVSQSLENGTNNRTFDNYDTNFLQKRIPYNMSSCSQLENFPRSIDNYPPSYRSSMQNNIDSVSTIPGQNLLDANLYSNIQSSSRNKELPHTQCL